MVPSIFSELSHILVGCRTPAVTSVTGFAFGMKTPRRASDEVLFKKFPPQRYRRKIGGAATPAHRQPLTRQQILLLNHGSCRFAPAWEPDGSRFGSQATTGRTAAALRLLPHSHDAPVALTVQKKKCYA
jgi:hypothetical protein